MSVFLAGAKSRLLPASIPFRYFGAAVVYHALAWLALLADPAGVPRFPGSLGWPLAALHLVTLGVLAMTTIGASLQLLPVATRQPVHSPRAAAAIWWLYTPSVGVLCYGMGSGAPWPLAWGAMGVVLSLLGYAWLLVRNLAGASGIPAGARGGFAGVLVHGWGAFGSLVVLLVSALALSLLYVGMPFIARDTALALHVAFALYGFMGLFALGLSYVLVPMFALSPAPDERVAIASCALAVAALGLAAAAAFGVAPAALRVAAIAAGAVAVALHLHAMRKALAAGMRRELGRSFVLVRVAWGLLAASLAAALALVLDAWDGAGALFGVVAVAGWLLTFVLGLLQRIAPFLASMHVGGRRPPTPSSLTAERPLALHFHAHLAALALLAAAVVVDSALLVVLAAAVGAFGAMAYASFFAVLLRRAGLIGVSRLGAAARLAWVRRTGKDHA